MDAALDALGYDIEKQLLLLLYALILGVTLGAVFDVFRISRVFLTVDTKKRVLLKISDSILFGVSLIGDVLFFMISAVSVVLFCFQANRGTARGFILFGAAVGFFLYLQTVGRLTKLISAALSRFMWAVLEFIYVRIIVPIFRFSLKSAKFVYEKTAARLIKAVICKCRAFLDGRRRKKLSRKALRMSNKTKGLRDEPGTNVNTGKARNTAGVHIYDNHSRQHPDTLQQSGRRTGKAERAHRRCAGKY